MGSKNRKNFDLINQELEFPNGYKPPKGLGHSTSFSSTRKAIYRGKKISVKTTYTIKIDGEPIKSHIMVKDDGSVVCHGLPNYAFGSAVEMAKSIIDHSY